MGGVTAGELASWLMTHGWTILTHKPAVVVATRGHDSRRTYVLENGYWRIAEKRGRKVWPGSRHEEGG